MDFEVNSMLDAKKGYSFDCTSGIYCCLVCGAIFEDGEIYNISEKLFVAEKAIQLHLEKAHPDYLELLINSDSKYNSLTSTQRNLFKLFAEGLPDKDIAKQLGISLSTVRHQKFTFREKAKQAKQYLATYESVFENNNTKEPIMMPIQSKAFHLDERFFATEEEQQHILETSFSSLEPLRLDHFPRKEKKKVVILAKILTSFEKGKEYSEKEVNEILAPIYEDFATLRRYLIDYGFMQRTKDGKRYWVV